MNPLNWKTTAFHQFSNDQLFEILQFRIDVFVVEQHCAYPELEEVLIGLAPPFKKLKNPLLRKSVAKIATIKHIWQYIPSYGLCHHTFSLFLWLLSGLVCF